MTDKFVVQRLTGLEWFGICQAFEDGHAYRVVQVFDSLRRVLRQLDDFYGDLVGGQEDTPIHMPHPRFFPFYTTYDIHGSQIELHRRVRIS